MMVRKCSIFLFYLVFSAGCSTSKLPVEESPEYISSNPEGKGTELDIEFTAGPSHNHPLMVVWIEDEKGNFIQTLYVAESIGKGVFRHGDSSGGFWMPGEIRRPAALPRWSHRRGIRAKDGLYVPTPDSPVPDAYTGPTPGRDFVLQTRLDDSSITRFYVLFEINQTWDWNEYWTNNKFPDDNEYKSSCQPAVVYSTFIDLNNPRSEYKMKITGRSHESGADGNIYNDLNTLTTALHIAEEIVVRVRQ